MPESKKIVESYLSSSPTVLIINEIGGVGSHLVDTLLSLGCQVFYFGNKKNDEISHLVGRNNFVLLKNLYGVQKLTSLQYVFYLGDSSIKLLSNLIQIIKKSSTKFLLAFPGDEELAQKLVLEISSLGIDIRVCLFNQIFGPRVKTGFFTSTIITSLEKEKIKIVGDGTKEIPLIFSGDFVKGVNRAMFSPETSKKIFYLGGEPVSLLNFVAELEKKLQKKFSVEFVQEKNELRTKLRVSSDNDGLNWRPETSLSEGIGETISWLKINKIKSILPEKKIFLPNFKLSTGKKKKLIFGLSFFSFLTLTFFVLPFSLFSWRISLVKRSLARVDLAWSEGDYSRVRKDISKAREDLVSATKIFGVFSPFYELFGLNNSVNKIESVLNLGNQVLGSYDSSLKAVDLFITSLSPLLKGESIDAGSKTKEIDQLLEASYLDSSMAWSYLENDFQSEAVRLFGLEKYFFRIKEILPSFRHSLLQARIILPTLTDLIGEKGRKSYLILFQDNLELRPTGGFINSVGLLTFEKEKLIDFKIQGVSLLDRDLHGQAEPPRQIKDYLGEKNWFLRDANWSPDFPTSAQKIIWFFEKETGIMVDGVFACNLQTFQKIIEVIGEVYLPESKEKINSQNIFERIAYFSTSNAVPGLNQNLDLEEEIALTVWEKVKSVSSSVLLKLLAVIYTNLNNKDFLLYFSNPRVEEITRTFNWDGSLQENPSCNDIFERCINDYLAINEANLGVNKANFFLKRMISQTVTLSEDGSLLETLKIFYQNLALSDAWPGGVYKNYLRLFLPRETQLESVALNNSADPGFWVELPKSLIEVATESGKVSFGFLVEIPIKSGRTVEVKYVLPLRVDFNKSFTYLLLNQRQSGTNETPYSFSFNFLNKTRPLKVVPKGVVSGGKVLVNDSLDKDKILRLDFGP